MQYPVPSSELPVANLRSEGSGDFSGAGSDAIFLRRRSGDGPGWDGWRSTVLDERDVDVFEEGSGGDAADAFLGLYEVVTGKAGLFAAKNVGEDEWFGELTGAHQKTGAVDGPLAFYIHGAFFHPSRRAGTADFRLRILAEHGQRAAEIFDSGGVTVRAQVGWVNYTRIVQRVEYSFPNWV